MPTVPPIDRKNVADEVATPMSLAGTSFWMARISVCMHRPSPRPASAMISIVCHIGVSTPICANRNIDTETIASPTTGNRLYRPVFEIRMPLPIDATRMPAVIGRVCRPDSVGVAPFTICRYSGSDIIMPNMPIPITKLMALVSENTGRRNNRIGSSASSPIARSTSTNATSPSAPMRVHRQRRGGAPAPLAALLGDDQQRHQRER